VSLLQCNYTFKNLVILIVYLLYGFGRIRIRFVIWLVACKNKVLTKIKSVYLYY